MAGPLLVCAATLRELDAANPAGAEVIAAVTGVGIPMTLLSLEPLLREHRPSLILNVGIAGAYPGSGLSLGEAVAGESEVFGDLGLESPGPERFIPLATQPWASLEYREPLALSLEPWAALPAIRRGRGCTVNACTGTAETGALRRRLFGADFESMEGAAVALIGKRAGIPVAELRTISNIASDRDMRPENIESALRALGEALRPLLGAVR
jgi:futalosine hydrolase